MKKLLLSAVLALVSTAGFADTYVNGYYKSNGTYVAPHYRSSPNSTVRDNWSTKGNYNPHTGKVGTKTYGSQRDKGRSSRSSRHSSTLYQ